MGKRSNAWRGCLALLTLTCLVCPPLRVAADPAPAAAGSASPARPSPGEDALPPYSHPETRQVVALVEAASAEIRRRGEVAFPFFRARGSRWFQGDRYVFVLDPDGNRFVYPPDPRNERLNLLSDTDLGGKPVGKLLVEAAAEPGGRGWVHYQWRRPNPDDRRPVWKATYVQRVKAPSGKTYLVGSGNYDGPTEKAFVVEAVNAAADLLQRRGRDGFPLLRDRNSRFVYRDTYVFVNDPAGVELVNAGFPELEGRNLISLKDATGNSIVEAYIKVAMEQGAGWTRYLWPQPNGSSLPLRKTTFVRKVTLPDGEVLVVGSGIYDP